MLALLLTLLAANDPALAPCYTIKDRASQQHCVESAKVFIANTAADNRMNVPDGNRSVRPALVEMRGALQAAISQNHRGRIRELLSALDQITSPTPYERYLVNRLKVTIYSVLDEDDKLLAELERLKWDAHLEGKERNGFVLNLAKMQYDRKLFDKAKYSAMELTIDPHPDLVALQLLAMSQYQLGEYDGARFDANRLIAERQKRGEPVDKNAYIVSLNSAVHLKQEAEYEKVMRMARQDYPEDFRAPSVAKKERGGGFMDGLMGVLDFGSKVVMATAGDVAAQRSAASQGVAWSAPPASPTIAGREPPRQAARQGEPAPPVTAPAGTLVQATRIAAASPQPAPSQGRMPPPASRQPETTSAKYFSGPLACVSSPSTSSVSLCKGAIAAAVTNGCSEPVDVRICLMTSNGIWDCGVIYGVQPGKSASYPSCKGTGQTYSDARLSSDNRPLGKPP